MTSKERSPIAPVYRPPPRPVIPAFDAISWHGVLAPTDTARDHQQADRRVPGAEHQGTPGEAGHAESQKSTNE